MGVDKKGHAFHDKRFSGQESHREIEKEPWFYDPEWQMGEMKAQQDIDEGKTYLIENAGELISKVKKI